jgi:quinol monooxygenase YgiN
VFPNASLEKDDVMTVARLYRMTAAEGKEEALRDALTDLERLVRPLEGCEGVELLRDARKPGSFLFIEKWASIEAHKSSSSKLPKDTLGPVLATLAGPPEGAYLDYLIGG